MDKDNRIKSTAERLADNGVSRRQFVTAAGIASVAVTAGFAPGAARAADLPRVSEDGATAKALNYVHDARTVDAARRNSTSFCNNCALYAGDTSDEWAKCSIFPGKVVAGAGWCSAWAPKPQS